jgi:hypothetical protein
LLQKRFVIAEPGVFGMSRMAGPSSMGEHFRPRRASITDFASENSDEAQAVAKLEANHVQVGIYLVGAAILRSQPSRLDYRALKGPATITAGTPRPAWYPGDFKASASPDPLPDWNQIYPVARRAMASFHDGGAGFETRLGSWDIAARPVTAEKRCALCHGSETHIGGLLYAFRRAKD